MQVLAEQVPSVPNIVLILCVAVGVGIFLAAAMLRTHTGMPLARLLIVLYGMVIILAFLLRRTLCLPHLTPAELPAAP